MAIPSLFPPDTVLQLFLQGRPDYTNGSGIERGEIDLSIPNPPGNSQPNKRLRESWRRVDVINAQCFTSAPDSTELEAKLHT